MIILDYNDKRPIYEQIVEKLTTLILRGVYEADEKLPSVRSMAVDLSINPNTIQRAYGELERQGYIYSIKGRGNFVRDIENLAIRKKEKALENLRGIIEDCRRIGIPEEEIRSLTGRIYSTGQSAGEAMRISDGEDSRQDGVRPGADPSAVRFEWNKTEETSEKSSEKVEVPHDRD